MSKYDPILGKHYLKEVNDNQRYLLPKIQNRFIHILRNHAKENILDRIQKANYFAIKTAHWAFLILIKWVLFVNMSLLKTKKGRCEIHFLFFYWDGKTANDIKKMILDRLEKEKLDFKQCRGIGFDNAACMAGENFMLTLPFVLFIKKEPWIGCVWKISDKDQFGKFKFP